MQSVQRCLNLLFQHSLFLTFFLFQKYLKPKVRTTKLVNSVVYHPCSSRLASGIHPFSLNSISFRNACWIFSELYIPICVGKHFRFMVLTFVENALNLSIFTHAPVPHSKLQVESFENLLPTRWKGSRKLWFDLLKFNEKIWRWLGTLVYLHLAWFVIFLNVMALQFCK